MKTLLILLSLTLTLFAKTVMTDKIEIFYFYDKNRSCSIDHLIANDEMFFTKQLDPIPERFPRESSVWLKIQLDNTQDVSVAKVVKFLDIRIDRMDIYDAKGVFLHAEGDRVPFVNRVHKDAQIAIDVRAEPLSPKVIYINLQHKTKADASYVVFDQHKYIEHIIFKSVVEAFFFGSLVIMLLYNFVLYLFIREKVFLLYVVYHAVLLVVMLYYNGVMSEYFHPEQADLNAGSVPRIWIYLAIILATEFLRNFLQTKMYTPKLDKTLFVFILVSLILLILDTMQLTTSLHPQTGVIVMIPQSVFLLYVAFYHALINRRKIALFYILGWSIMMLSIVITGLLSLGFIPRNDITSYLFQAGSFIEILLLSMGLAYRYNESQKVITYKDRQLREINENLEATIIERTEELDREVKYAKSLLADREILFKELYHRVKNNLQMLTSLLSMQVKRVDDENAKGVLKEFIGRIKSLALLHEKLQSSNQLDRINMQEYLRSLLEEMKNTAPFVNLEFDLQSQDIYLKIDQVTPIGLIVNELTSNSFKHAFDNVERQKITVHLKEVSETHLELFYSDNGNGTSSLENSMSLGTVLIDTLGRSQLKGEITIEMKPSLSYTIVFPKL